MTLLLQILAVLAFLAVWGFIIMGMVMNAQVWWIALHAKEGDQIPSGRDLHLRPARRGAGVDDAADDQQDQRCGSAVALGLGGAALVP